MQRKYLVINWSLFIMFTALLGLATIELQMSEGSILFNEAIAMLLFCISFPLKIYKIRAGQYIILVLLLVLLFSPLHYSYTTTEGDRSVTYDEMRFTSLVSPLTFLILLVFLAFNYRAMIGLYQLLTRGSEKEQNEELSKEIEFYYSKFNGCSNSELTDIFKMYNDYPVGAQVALNRIRKEKDIY